MKLRLMQSWLQRTTIINPFVLQGIYGPQMNYFKQTFNEFSIFLNIVLMFLYVAIMFGS